MVIYAEEQDIAVENKIFVTKKSMKLEILKHRNCKRIITTYCNSTKNLRNYDFVAVKFKILICQISGPTLLKSDIFLSNFVQS